MTEITKKKTCAFRVLLEKLDRLAKLLLNQTRLQTVGGFEEVVRPVILVPRVGLRRDAELFHANFACTTNGKASTVEA